MDSHGSPTTRIQSMLIWLRPFSGLLIFLLIVTSGYLLETYTATIETVSCKFGDAYVVKGGKGGSYWLGECWNNKIGTVKAVLKGEGLAPRKGTWVEMTTIKSVLRTYNEVDIASRAEPEKQ